MKSARLHTTANRFGGATHPAGHSDSNTEIQVFLPGYNRLPEATARGDRLLTPDRLPVSPTRRLVVIVPPGEIEENLLARRIWQLAADSNLNVLYTALALDDSHLIYQRRRLASLTSLTTGKDVHVKVSLRNEKSWPQALGNLLRPGDLLVCLANHQIPAYLVWRRALGEMLPETTGTPVYLLGGMEIGRGPQWLHTFKSMQAWFATLAMIAIFFGLQVWINQSSTGSLSTILLYLSVMIEIFSIYKINEWIG